MNYEGKIYGKIGSKYIPLQLHSKQVDEALKDNFKVKAENKRLLQIITNVHDRILRGDSDKELMDMLEKGWKENEK